MKSSKKSSILNGYSSLEDLKKNGLLKKQAILLLLFFLTFIILAPVAFAYNSSTAAPLGFKRESLAHAPLRRIVRSQDTSSPSFIRFRCTSMNFRSFNDLRNVKTVLGPNSIVQLPNFPGLGVQVHEYNRNGSINFNKTISNWLEMAKYQRSKLRSRHLIPKSLNGEIYLPVKVIQASDSRFNTDSRDAYGYLALDFLRKKVNPHCYEATTMVTKKMLRVGHIVGQRPPVAGGEFNNGRSETTQDVERVGGFVRPKDFEDLSQSRIFNCNNTRYRRNGYSRHSCLRSMDLKRKAKLVMTDIMEINKLRPELKLDPRFSLCIAYRESGLAPNAQGSSNDSGMYQVTDSTARHVLGMHTPVTPSFSRYRGSQRLYKTAMLRSTLAQADLHHSVVLAKAKQENLLRQINRNPQNVHLLQKLATRYNGSGRRARNYGRKVARCYRAMQQVASVDGRVHNPSGLKKALRMARG